MHDTVASPPRSPFARLFTLFVDWAQTKIVAASTVGDHPIFDVGQFSWVPRLEIDWRAIRTELDTVLVDRERLPAFHEITPAVRTITTDAQWKTFMFLGYGLHSQRNLERCPRTAEALSRVPGLRTAFFSILEPGKRIPPHRGPYNGVLRLHLGLIIPTTPERCWIRVHDQRRYWEEGKALILDDAYVHEVHNDTDQLRVVLFLDFDRPCRGWVRWLNRLILALAPLTPALQEAKVNHHAWEKKVYGDKP